MSSYRRHYLPSISRSDVKGGVRLIQPYSVTDYFLIFRVQNLLTSADCIIFIVLTNRYGHPHAEVVESLKEMGVNVLRTDESGAIIIRGHKGGK